MASLKNANEDEDRQPGCFGVMRIPPGLQNKTMHLLPFGTNYTGPAPVADYFKHKAAGNLNPFTYFSSLSPLLDLVHSLHSSWVNNYNH